MNCPALFSSLSWVSMHLLVVAIALFKVSTLQMRWPFRLLAWTSGAACVAGAATVSLCSKENYGVWKAVLDIGAHWRDPDESLAWQAISQNLGTLPNYLSAVTDFAILVVGLLAIGALIAFTPGQRWERFTRTALIGVIGGVIGALMTVGVVALGFGGEAHRAVMIGDIGTTDLDAEIDETAGEQVVVLDGDTIKIGATSIRLWGIDAPELGQSCGSDPTSDCGQTARAGLYALIRGHLIECRSRTTRNGSRVESFGRPLMQCAAISGDGERFDVARRMLQAGYAVLYYPQRGNEPAEPDYAKHAAPFSMGCTLRPDWWRHSATRNEYLSGEHLPEDRLIGNCPAQPATSSNTSPS